MSLCSSVWMSIGDIGVFSIDPNAWTTSTEWCATIARPDSETMLG